MGPAVPRGTVSEKELLCFVPLSHPKLVQQYSATVAGLFFGHIHKDEFRAYQTASLLAVPSITPIYDNNPGYRVVSAQANGQPTDYWQYYLYLWV